MTGDAWRYCKKLDNEAAKALVQATLDAYVLLQAWDKAAANPAEVARVRAALREALTTAGHPAGEEEIHW